MMQRGCGRCDFCREQHVNSFVTAANCASPTLTGVNVDGAVPIRDLNRVMNWNLPDKEATTIAGLVIHEAQSIPEERQAFTFHGKRFIVMKRDKNRIARIRIKPVAQI